MAKNNTTYFLRISKNFNLILPTFESYSNLSADSFKKNTDDLDGSIPEPTIRSGDSSNRMVGTSYMIIIMYLNLPIIIIVLYITIYPHLYITIHPYASP